jgi:hypothetical protein
MDPGVVTFAEIIGVIVAAVAALAGVGIVAKWSLVAAKRRELRSSQLDIERLERLQQSIDAIAIEVERITEAQRFSAKLLAERKEESRVPR